MKTSDFFYNLPEVLIAQTPIEPRNSSRLMVLDKENGNISHSVFSSLFDYGKQIFFVVKVKVHVAFCDNP